MKAYILFYFKHMNSTIIHEWLNTAGLVLVGVVIFVGGFYFGGKSAHATIAKEQAQDDAIAGLAQEAISIENENSDNLVQGLSVPGVFWIKVGEPPVCPDSHPLKGKFDKNVNVYYRQDYPQFDRVKPHICLASEEFASQQAGFIRKY